MVKRAGSFPPNFVVVTKNKLIRYTVASSTGTQAPALQRTGRQNRPNWECTNGCQVAMVIVESRTLNGMYR